MSGALRYQGLTRGNISFVRLHGTVDETFDESELFSEATGRDVILNLKGISRISSFGVREWVNAMGHLAEKCDRIVYVECSSAIVMQMNMIANFAEHATVVSVAIPFHCESCAWETELIHEVANEKFPDAPSCKRCGTTMDPDEDPENYLAFCKGAPNKPLDVNLAQFLQDFEQANEAPVDVREPAPRHGAKTKLFAALKRVDSKRQLGQRIVKARLGHGIERARPYFDRAVTWLRQTTRRQRTIAASSAAVVILAGAILCVPRGPEGIPPQQLTSFHKHLQNLEFEQATQLVNKWVKEKLTTPTLVEALETQIHQKRQTETQKLRLRIDEHYRKKRYKEVIQVGQEAAALEPHDAPTLFMLAEAHRRSGDLKGAVPLYAEYAAKVEMSGKSTSKLDDALFWQGEYFAKSGKTQEARELLERVAYEMKSNFRRSAIRRLKRLK